MRGVKTETAPTPETFASELLVAPPLWRLQLVRVLQVIGILLGAVGGADWINLIALFPEETAKWLAVSGPAFAAAVRPVIEFFGDWIDDGQLNKSFRISAILLPMALVFSLALSSCAGVTSGWTGQPIPTVPVQRTDGTGRPIDIAASDVLRAEQSPSGTAWGLYDAGAVADAVSPTVEAGK